MTKIAFIGYGDIAERTCKALALAGFTMMQGLCRHPQNKRTYPGVSLVAGDVSNATDLENFIDASVSTLVLTLTPNRTREDAYFDGYVLPCRLLQHHLQSKGLSPRIIFVSSSGVYGQREGEWISEETIAEPSDQVSKLLLQAEQVISSISEQVTILRCSGIYGPNRTRLAELLISGDALITPAWTNRIHADDVAGFIAYLIQHPEHQRPLYLISDDEPLLQEEAYRRLAKRLGVDLEGLKRVEEVGRRGSKRIDNRLLKASGYQLLYPTYQPR